MKHTAEALGPGSGDGGSHPSRMEEPKSKSVLRNRRTGPSPGGVPGDTSKGHVKSSMKEGGTNQTKKRRGGGGERPSIKIAHT